MFDGVRTLEMPEIAKRVHVPWEGRWGLLRALRALAEGAGVKHNIPEAAAAEEEEGEEAKVGQGGGGRGDGAMLCASTDYLWIGWLREEVRERTEQLRADVCGFLQGHAVASVRPCYGRGTQVGAHVELATPITQVQLAELNTREYHDGRRLTVDDAQRGNPYRAARQQQQQQRTGAGKGLQAVEVEVRGAGGRAMLDGAALDEGCAVLRVEAGSAASVAGLFAGMRVSAVGGAAVETRAELEAALLGCADEEAVLTAVVDSTGRLRGTVDSWDGERCSGRVSPAVPVFVSGGVLPGSRGTCVYLGDLGFRRGAFTSALGGGGAERELWHGTACSVLDAVLRTGLQCPSDTRASEACPVSGGRGLCTTMCGADCAHCTEAHGWGRCHMFGLGIYLADDPRKSHAYVRPVGRRHSLVRCRVNLGSPYLIEANLLQRDGMHGVVRCVDPQGKLDRNPHEWGVLKGHEAYCVKGLGAAARPEHGVINTEYVLFHPAQVLPLYVVDYETAGPVAPAAPRAVPASRGGFDLARVDVQQQRRIWNQIQKARGRSVQEEEDDDDW